MTPRELYQLLVEIALAPDPQPAIGRLQTVVWGAEADSLGANEELLRELAHDLDYFVPDPRARAWDASYYGLDRLSDVVAAAMRMWQA
jgi:hypothetical protein